jgi:hypothetical protein
VFSGQRARDAGRAFVHRLDFITFGSKILGHEFARFNVIVDYQNRLHSFHDFLKPFKRLAQNRWKRF